VLGEVNRVLKPMAGRFVFTDPMRADDCPEGVLDPILARIHLLGPRLAGVLHG
jgi:sarcosine/dimethylglycine N-methyltransferase